MAAFVDRTGFQLWKDGVVMHFRNGKGYAVNELECEAGEKALKKGEVVYLRDATGKVVSKMSKVGKVYQEQELTDEDRALIAKELIG